MMSSNCGSGILLQLSVELKWFHNKKCVKYHHRWYNGCHSPSASWTNEPQSQEAFPLVWFPVTSSITRVQAEPLWLRRDPTAGSLHLQGSDRPGACPRHSRAGQQTDLPGSHTQTTRRGWVQSQAFGVCEDLNLTVAVQPRPSSPVPARLTSSCPDRDSAEGGVASSQWSTRSYFSMCCSYTQKFLF